MKQLKTLEDFSEKHSPIHRISPMAKLVVTFVFIVTVVSCGRYGFFQILPFFSYIILLPAVSEIPYKTVFKYVLPVLPISFLAGISNVILERQTAVYIAKIPVSYGFLSLATILLKTFLTVSAVIILSATTRAADINRCLLKLKIPSVLVMQIFMTYRYLCIISDEARLMYCAYILRSNGKKGIHIKHFGSFLGQLLLRSFARAERVFLAMKCAGYNETPVFSEPVPQKLRDVLYAVSFCAIFVILKFGGVLC